MNPPDHYLSRNLVSVPFHDPQLLQDIWGESWGVSNEVGRIRRILMHRPGAEVRRLHRHAHDIEAGPVLRSEIRGRGPGGQQDELPELELLQAQHDALRELLEREGIEVVPLADGAQEWPECLFTRDLGLVIPGGAILSRFALYLRYGETRLAAHTLSSLGMPIAGMIQGCGFAEGGSFLLLDERTALVGRSERVNPAGIEQIRSLLALQDIQLLVIDLPSTIIHIDEALLLLDYRKALVNTALLPFWFLEELHSRGIELIHVDPDDPPLTINALTIEPGRVVFPASGVRTIRLLQQSGVEVLPVDVSEIYKLGGGIHCLTLPLIRQR